MANPASTDDFDRLSRDDMMAILEETAIEASRKCRNGRIRSSENERVRCQQWKALAYVVNAWSSLYEDEQEVAEIRRKLEELERIAGGASSSPPVEAD